jgi:hypothetical protein
MKSAVGYKESRLQRVAVSIVDEKSVLLRCDGCGQAWSPNILPGGKMPRGYRQCPNGCNRHPEGR